MRGNGRVFRPKALRHRPHCPTRKVKGKWKTECGCPRVATRKWWIDYTVGGERFVERTGVAQRTLALQLLRERIGDRESGKVVGRPDRVTLSDLRAPLKQRYALKANKSLPRALQAFVHLDRLIGAKRRVSELTQDVINDYLERRVSEGRARSTANYEVGILSSALSQAVENRLLRLLPRFKLPKVRNARQGFFTPGEFAALLLELPKDVRPVVQLLHTTGWRLEEALSLTWAQVDWHGLVIRIGGDRTKGEDDRVFPFGVAPELRALLEDLFVHRRGMFVFHRSGRRIRTFRKAWRNACRRAGVEGKLVHDLRRTAAREFRRAGVTEGEIMKASGWKTRSMFDRYNIIDEDDLAQGLAKRFAHDKQTRNTAPSPQQEPSVTSSSTR
jgi:integrase